MLALTILALALSMPHPERLGFVEKQLLLNGVSRPEIRAIFRDERINKPLPQLPQRKKWPDFERDLFLPESIDNGILFREGNFHLLERIRGKRGLRIDFTVALFRIESNFNLEKREFIAFNVFYRKLQGNSKEWVGDAKQLVTLVLYCKRMKLDCFTVMSSEAGAIGPGQFLPDTWRMYGEDGDGDGLKDMESMVDSSFGMAHYLVKLGWHRNELLATKGYLLGAGNRNGKKGDGYANAVFRYEEKLK